MPRDDDERVAVVPPRHDVLERVLGQELLAVRVDDENGIGEPQARVLGLSEEVGASLDLPHLHGTSSKLRLPFVPLCSRMWVAK